MNTCHMEEFDIIENYLRHGDYPIGRYQYIKDKKIMVALLPVQQQTAGTLTCGVIAIAPTIFLVVIRALFLLHLYCTCLQPDCRYTYTCGVIAIALTYHFSRGNSISFIFVTSVLHMFATRMDQHMFVFVWISFQCVCNWLSYFFYCCYTYYFRFAINDTTTG